MKNLLLAILLVFLFPAILIAQIDTTVVVYSWKLDEFYAKRIRATVDTALDNFQNYNPVFRQYTGVATLGNIGLPAQSIVYDERPQNKEFIIINNFLPFMKLQDNTCYFNTRKPFTRITYLNGGSSQIKEERLEAFHTQNLTKTLNVGLHYTTSSSLGHYRFQKVKNNSFRFFSNLAGQVYSYHLSFNMNKIVADENGGVLNDALITDTTYTYTKDIPTLFGGVETSTEHSPDVFSEVRNINLLAVQEVAFRGNRQKPDSGSSPRRLKIFYPKLIYIFSLDRNIRLFTDKNPAVGLESGLYPALNVSNSHTSDSLLYWKILNTLRLQFQGKKNNHYFVDYSYEYTAYSMAVAADQNTSGTNDSIWFITDVFKLPALNYNSRLVSSFLSSGFEKVFANLVELSLYGRYYFTGYKATDFILGGDLKFTFGDAKRPVTLQISGTNELHTPDFLYTHYASNNFLWTRSFDKTSLNHLSMNLLVSSKKFEIQGDYYLFRNYIYLNEEAFPDQYQNPLSLFSVSAYKRFDFWKVSSISKLAFQKSENENILDLPAIALYNSTYLTHMINFKATGGKLLTMIGFDLYYNTKYYADAYMPALASFHRQKEKQLGNYPYFDAFLNVQLKRFRIFLKMEHVNSGWIDKNYFSVLHYPRNDRSFKVGLTWTFYD
jgi:hypothetical protein